MPTLRKVLNLTISRDGGESELDSLPDSSLDVGAVLGLVWDLGGPALIRR